MPHIESLAARSTEPEMRAMSRKKTPIQEIPERYTTEDERELSTLLGERALKLEDCELIGNRYRVIKELGKGGMGVAHLVFNEKLRRLQVMKRLHADLLQNDVHDQSFRRRFLREIRTLANSHSPYVVTAYDVITIERGAEPEQALIMDYIRGKDLHDTLKQERY